MMHQHESSSSLLDKILLFGKCLFQVRLISSISFTLDNLSLFIWMNHCRNAIFDWSRGDTPVDALLRKLMKRWEMIVLSFLCLENDSTQQWNCNLYLLTFYRGTIIDFVIICFSDTSDLITECQNGWFKQRCVSSEPHINGYSKFNNLRVQLFSK